MNGQNPEFNHEFRNGRCHKCGRSVGEDVLRPTTCSGSMTPGVATDANRPIVMTARPIGEFCRVTEEPAPHLAPWSDAIERTLQAAKLQDDALSADTPRPSLGERIGEKIDELQAAGVLPPARRMFPCAGPLTVGIDGPVIGTFTAEEGESGKVVGTATVFPIGDGAVTVGHRKFDAKNIRIRVNVEPDAVVKFREHIRRASDDLTQVARREFRRAIDATKAEYAAATRAAATPAAAIHGPFAIPPGTPEYAAGRRWRVVAKLAGGTEKVYDATDPATALAAAMNDHPNATHAAAPVNGRRAEACNLNVTEHKPAGG